MGIGAKTIADLSDSHLTTHRDFNHEYPVISLLYHFFYWGIVYLSGLEVKMVTNGQISFLCKRMQHSFICSNRTCLTISNFYIKGELSLALKTLMTSCNLLVNIWKFLHLDDNSKLQFNIFALTVQWTDSLLIIMSWTHNSSSCWVFSTTLACSSLPWITLKPVTRWC